MAGQQSRKDLQIVASPRRPITEKLNFPRPPLRAPTVSQQVKTRTKASRHPSPRSSSTKPSPQGPLLASNKSKLQMFQLRDLTLLNSPTRPRRHYEILSGLYNLPLSEAPQTCKSDKHRILGVLKWIYARTRHQTSVAKTEPCSDRDTLCC